jgi:WD40 repeat protein
MSSPSDPDEDRLAELLDEYEAALAAGQGAEFLDRQQLTEEQRKRLERAVRCVDLLAEHWQIYGGEHRNPLLTDLNIVCHNDLPARIGRFEVRTRLGEGAFGIVYAAYDPQLDRHVALKVAKPGMLGTEAGVKRFLREAKAAANLRHPHIVPIFDAGREGEQYYIASAFIRGKSLAGALEERPEGQGLEPGRAVEIVRRLADALAYAHRKGIVHRDVKPANVMLDEQGEPMLMDFGLAARADGDEKLTQEATIMGTPAYRAPEQAQGKAEAASDQYSLACTLFELLTGKTPFAGPPHMQLLLHQSQEPPPPRTYTRKVPRDLETICLKGLAKNPPERYPGCRELADDLRRWLEGEPILARRLPWVERFWRWVRKKPALAAVYSLLALVLVLGGSGAGAIRLWQQTEAARQEAESGRQREASLRRRLAEISYLNQIGLAHREFSDGAVTRAEQLLQDCPMELRDWEWHYVSRLCHTDRLTLRGHTGGVNQVTYQPDGQRLFSGGGDGTLRGWDARTGQLLFSWQATTGPLANFALSPDGKTLAWVGKDQTVKLRAVFGDKDTAAFAGPFTNGAALAFRPDGRQLATAAVQRALVNVWDVSTRQEVLSLPWPISGVHSLSFSPDGRYLVASCSDGPIRWFDLTAGREAPERMKSPCVATSIDFSPDGKLLAGRCEDQSVRVWESATGVLRLTLWAHNGGLNRIAFSPDSSRLACSNSTDHTVRVWDTATGKELLCLRGHQARTDGVAYSPDGRHLASTSGDATVKVWDTDACPEGILIEPHAGWVQTLAFHPDSGQLASALNDGTVRLWAPDTGKELLRIHAHPGRTFGVAYSPDGGWLVSVGAWQQQQQWTGAVKVWDVASGKLKRTLVTSLRFPYRVAFSPDGERVACACGLDDRIQVWETKTGRSSAPYPGGVCVAFSHDSRRILAGTIGGEIKVRDAATGREVLSLKGHSDCVTDVAVSRDGKWIASSSYDATVKVWDAASGRLVTTYKQHTDRVLGVAFSRDGRRVVSSSDDRTVRLFVPDTGDEVLVLKGHAGPVHHVCVSPDGRRIATGGWDGTVRIWDTVADTDKDRVPEGAQR